MPTQSYVNNLYINKLTSAQFDEAVRSGTILDSDISILSDGEYIQYSTMPEASEENENLIVQYIGETDTDYINGYWYKCVLDEGPVASITLDRTDLLQLDAQNFANLWAYAITNWHTSTPSYTTTEFLEGLWPDPNDPDLHFVKFIWTNSGWTIQYNSTEDVGSFIGKSQTELDSLGITCANTPNISDYVMVKPIYYRASSTYKWIRIDVQPNIQREVLDNTSNYNGEIVQYIGNTTDNYTQGYFYKSVNGYEYAGETDRTYSGTNYMYLSVDNLKLTSFLDLYGYTYTDTNIILLSITSDPANPYTVSSLNGDINASFSSIEELRAWTGINWGGTNYVTSTDPNAIRSTSNTSTEFKVTPGYLWEHIAVAGPDIVRDYTSTDIRIILGNVNNNKIFDLGEPATITVEGDVNTSEDFCCQINFGSTDPVPTDFITAGGIGIKMSGDDIDFTTNEFVPVAGRAYTIFFYYARNTFRGIVQGV